MASKPLPDTSKWLPRTDKDAALKNTLLQTCRTIEKRIISESQSEKQFNIDNYDSGPGIEDIIRAQLKKLLPNRYNVTAGVVVDGYGKTCGDCDFVITNNFWLPFVKYGATEESRRRYIPVEAVYTIIEVKQNINETILETAMEKIVKYKRLDRDYTPHDQITENYRLRDPEPPSNTRQLNYRYDVIIGIGYKDDDLDSIVKRFFEINATLTAKDRVNALAILGSGIAFYVDTVELGVQETMYPELTDVKHYPFFINSQNDTLFHLYTNLWQHLTRSVLRFGDFKYRYGRLNADLQGKFF